MATVEPPVGAACDNVTVQVEVPPEGTVVGAHFKVETVTAAGVTVIAPPLPEMAMVVPSDCASIG